MIECCFLAEEKAEETLDTTSELSPMEMLEKAREEAKQDKSTIIDPKFSYFTNDNYKICFNAEFDHGQHKRCKIYYIITKDREVHRLTVEKYVSGSSQRIFLNSETILERDGASNAIVWSVEFCTVDVSYGDNIKNPTVIWKTISIIIGEITYTLHANSDPYYNWGQVTDRNHYISKKHRSIFISLLCNSRLRVEKVGFGLEMKPCEGWILDIDSKTLIPSHVSYTMIDALLFIPFVVILTIIGIILIFLLCCPCMFKSNQEACDEQNEYEPVSVIFDANRGIEYVNRIQGVSSEFVDI
eukprot:237477_1